MIKEGDHVNYTDCRINKAQRMQKKNSMRIFI